MSKLTDERDEDWGAATDAIHFGYDPADSDGALSPPIYMTSTYAFENIGHVDELISGARKGYFYGRRTNPTQSVLEKRMARLEGGEAAMTAASGMSAIASAAWTLLKG
ncbi:methionine gamma-lyase, partial [Escherichia coli]|nr:methionine gamma-lyase [Escherichia coli]